MKYTPQVHTGTPDQIIDGLIGEADEIIHSGFMRMHAQCRELSRIEDELKKLGVTMLDGIEDDEGQTLFVKDHNSDCQLKETGVCDCKPFKTIDGSI